MRKWLFLLGLIISFAAYAQQGGIYTPTPVPTYGTNFNRAKFDTVLMFPTGCGTPNSLKWHSNDSSHAAKYFDSCNNKEYTWNPKTKHWGWILDSISISTNFIPYGGTGVTTGTTSYAIASGQLIDKIIFYDPATIYISIGSAVNLRNICALFTVTSATYSVISLSKYYASGATIYFNGVTASTIIKIYFL